jgi:tetratricopeptide (TPR) repeat protein
MVAVAAGAPSAYSQTHSAALALQPKETQSQTVSLGKDEAVKITVNLLGGIVGIREISPGGARPLWVLDLGRGAQVNYVLGGGSAGAYRLEFRSLEREKPVRLDLDVEQPAPINLDLIHLRDVEDLLANAELVRRHSKDAPSGLDAIQTYDQALTLATTLHDTPLMRLILTAKARFLIFQNSSFAEARTLLEQAAGLPPADDSAQQALAWKTLSTARYDLGEYQLAIDASKQALDLYRATGDLWAGHRPRQSLICVCRTWPEKRGTFNSQ